MPRARPVSLHSVVVWPFREAVRKLGIDVPPLPELEGPSGTSGPSAERTSHERARTLLELAVALTGREDLGVLAAEAVEPGHFDLVELATRTQRTVGEGIATLASLVPILHDGVVVKLVRAPGRSTLRITFDREMTLHPAGYDFIVASLVIGARRQTQRGELEPARVRLPYPAPDRAPALARLVRCPIEFDAAALELEFPTAALELPLARANSKVAEVAQHAARALIDSASEPSELERAVRARVLEGLATNAIDAKTLARKLHLSERTLRRRLEAEGIGLRGLVDDVRRERALSRLANATLSTEALAAELGFSTAQAFHRAFRRWTGGTVQAYRAGRR